MPDPLQETLILVERAQRDDHAAVQELFGRYLPRVRRIAALRLGRTTRDLLDVDDVTQDVMTTAFAKLDRFDVTSEGQFCNWLAKLVENRIRMDLRARGTAKRGGGREQRQADLESAVRESQVGGVEATPSQHAVGTETNEAIEQALLLMSERSRELVIHRSFCALEYGEIAELLGLGSADAARSLYSRALRELEQRLGDRGP
ncbi:MAG: sigma-70 family RNA polymerase sigma factor [Planctomycetota bacterium]